MEENNKKYPEGHFVGIWMLISVVIFLGLGVLITIITENTAIIATIGSMPAIGIAVGLAIGSAVEAKYKKQGKIRPLTEEEQKRKRRAVLVGLIILLIGVLAGFLVFFKLY